MTWDDWFRKRMRPFLGPWYYEMEEMMKEMEKMFEESMKEFEGNVPKELVREHKLPSTVDPTKAQASFKNGMLEVRLPKKSYGSEISIE